MDREARHRLRRKPLALWIHGYLSSDAENYDTKLETLRRLSGSKTKELKHFKINFKAALADLEAATDGRMGGHPHGGQPGRVEAPAQPSPGAAPRQEGRAGRRPPQAAHPRRRPASRQAEAIGAGYEVGRHGIRGRRASRKT